MGAKYRGWGFCVTVGTETGDDMPTWIQVQKTEQE